MIFRQIEEIIIEQKTQTRRVCKDNEELVMCYNAFHDKDVPTVVTRIYRGGRGIPDDTRIKWQVGRTYSVLPKRGMPQVYYRYAQDGEIQLAHTHTMPHLRNGQEITQLDFAKQHEGNNWRPYLKQCQYIPLFYRILDINRERLQLITEGDARAEGCLGLWHYPEDKWLRFYDPTKSFVRQSPRRQYKDLWQSINGKTKGKTWDDNPRVWVVEFQKVEV